MANEENEYILGTDSDELSRLGIQHRIWSDVAVSAWKRAGIMPGSHVLDLGCGPGHTTFEIANLTTESGLVLGVDESERFTNYLNDQSKIRNIPQVRSQIADAENLTSTLKTQKFDVVYTRWVLCWLRNPEKAIAEVAKALKPGGRFVIHEYFNWKSFTSAPRSKAIDKMVAQAVISFEKAGADIDIAGRLPKMLREAGFELKHLDTHVRMARGGGMDSTISWPVTWWRTYGPKLEQMGYLTSEECAAALSDVDAVEQSADKYFLCPPVFEFIATKS